MGEFKGSPMMAAPGRCVFAVFFAAAICCVGSGCAVGGKSFAIDSNSRIPFFGLELQERKPKSAAPAYRSIARAKSESSPVKAALQLFPSALKVLPAQPILLPITSGEKSPSRHEPTQVAIDFR
jgi:hypothetical protein